MANPGIHGHLVQSKLCRDHPNVIMPKLQMRKSNKKFTKLKILFVLLFNFGQSVHVPPHTDLTRPQRPDGPVTSDGHAMKSTEKSDQNTDCCSKKIV